MLTENRPENRRLIAGLVVVSALILFFVIYGEIFSFDYLKTHYQAAVDAYHQNPIVIASLFFILYTVYASLALPGVNYVMLLTGAVFGFWIGMLVSVVASTLGAIIVFLWSRYFFRDFLQKRYAAQCEAINQHIDREGAYYVIASHLVVGVPVGPAKILFGLTRLSLIRFSIAIFIAQACPGILFNYIGHSFGEAVNMSQLASPKLIALLAIAGILPLILHRLYQKTKSR